MARRNSAFQEYITEAGREQERANAPQAATDFDYLVQLGYPSERVREALATTRGDRSSALHILQKGGLGKKEASAWRSELKDDFSSGAKITNLPVSVDNRALWRTPFYIRVGETRTRNGKTFYTLSVVKKNGESWKIERSYSEFLGFKNSLPLFTTSAFKNPFPPKKDLVALFSTVNTELRRQALEEWMRELCLSELSMRNDAILALLGEFVEERKQGNPVQAIPSPDAAFMPSTPAGGMTRYGGTSPHAPLGSPTSTGTVNIASLQMLSGPLSYQQLKSALPFKIPLLEAPSESQFPKHTGGDFLERGELDSRVASLRYYSTDPSAEPSGEEGSMFRAAGPTGLDQASMSMRQLQKDFLRDRLILQGSQRLEGASCDIAQIVAAMQTAVAALAAQAGKPPLSAMFPAGFFVSILTAMSRTESAYLAHASLTNVLCSDSSSEIMVVPESSLADPIKISFRIKERDVGGDWCVICDMEAATVFRVNDAVTDDVATLLQVKTTYYKTVFGMPRLVSSGGRGEVVDFAEKAGKAVLVLEREMRSTARDWGGGANNPF